MRRALGRLAPLAPPAPPKLDCAPMREASIFFLSDAHLGAESESLEAGREARLHSFLESLPGRASTLYIVGDLFDFWFEYRTAIPRRLFRTLAVLEALKRSGVEIVYLNGNHDFWLGPFLSETIGLRTIDGAITVEAQGRRLWLHHGDGLVGGDLGYKFLRGILRSKLSIGMYQWLHPDLGIPLAHLVSNASRHSRGHGPLQPERLWREIALPRFAEGFDGVLVGHFHHVHEQREAGKDFFVLGDWIDHFSYVELADGKLEMKRWPQPA